MEPWETSVRARYAETDQMGVVYYSNYLVWMEVGRVEFCKARGFSYKEMEEHEGVLLAVAEASCRYAFPARFDDEVIVRTWIGEVSSRMLTFRYEMRLANSGRKVASGATRHVFCGKDMKPCRMPEKYRAMFGVAAGV